MAVQNVEVEVPVYPNMKDKIIAHLNLIATGEKPRIIAIGCLTDIQFATINGHRLLANLEPLGNPEVMYLGRHHHKSRVMEDEYTIEDMWLQIESALDARSEVVVRALVNKTGMRNPVARADGYGSFVHDNVALELTQRLPRAELFSAIPKGDRTPKLLREFREKLGKTTS